MALLLAVAVVSVADSTRALQKPFQLDYGEGIVLYQASTVLNLSHAYKPIDQYPYVVFHYPPLYHLAVITVARWTGNLLLAGRVVSFACGTLLQLLFGVMVLLCLPRRLDPVYRYGAALVAGLLPNCLHVWSWTRLARVDTLALLLSFAGAALFVLSGKSRPKQYCAFALFVAGVFTKQTMIAAPLACFIVLIIVDVRSALTVGLFGGVLGAGVLTGLAVATRGEVIKHLFLYNENPFEVRRLAADLSRNVVNTMALSALAGSIAVGAGIDAWRLFRQGRWERLRSWVTHSPTRRLTAVWSLLLLFAFVVSFTAGKVGANYNYFMEWNLACCPLAAIALWRILAEVRRRPRLTSITIVLLMVPLGVLLPRLPYTVAELDRLVRGTGDAGGAAARTPKYQDYRDALKIVEESAGPVFSEDMWLLVRSGKQVPAEPAIITQLAKSGRWNEQPFIRMIEEKWFRVIIITSSLTNSSRFSRGVAEAIRGAYRQTRQVGSEYSIYEPRTE